MKIYQLTFDAGGTIKYTGADCPNCQCTATKERAAVLATPMPLDSDEDDARETFPVDDSDSGDEVAHLSTAPLAPVTKTLANGTFVLVKLMGGRRAATQFRYAAIVEWLNLDGSVQQVTEHRSTNEKKDTFRVAISDRMVVDKDDVICELPTPEMTPRVPWCGQRRQ